MPAPSLPRSRSAPLRPALLLAALAALAVPAAAQNVELVSLGTGGAPADGDSYIPCLSDNGRWLVFSSNAQDLVEDDATAGFEPFLKDLKKGTLTRVALNDAGEEALGDSFGWGCSASGRWVVFESTAGNLAEGDEGGNLDVFVRDVKKGLTVCASRALGGAASDGDSDLARLSANGRFVAFRSAATDLVDGDLAGQRDIFVHDLKTGVTERVSVGHDGSEADGDSDRPTISANGRWVAFTSEAANLVPDDTNGVKDVFVRDRKLGTTVRASLSKDGAQAGGTFGAFASFLAANGRHVAIVTDASDMVAGDVNGKYDLFVRDLKLGTLVRASVGADDEASNGHTCASTDSLWLGGNGRYVAFVSNATNLVDFDDNGTQGNAFVRDLKLQLTRMADTAFDGSDPEGATLECTVSRNGRVVGFSSGAANLTPEAGGPEGSVDIFASRLDG
jgi:Tol biopolymer transport system component